MLAAIARYFIAIPVVIYSLEQFRHSDHVPGVPLARLTPQYLYGHAIWTYLAAIIYAVGGVLLLVGRKTRAAATWVGLIVLCLSSCARNRKPIGQIGNGAVEKRRVRKHVDRVSGRMEFHDTQVSVSSVRHVLVIRQDLIDEVSIHRNVGAVSGGILARSTNFMPTNDKGDVLVLTYKFCPHRIPIVVGSEAVVLGVKAVAGRHSRVVKVFVSMGDNDDLYIGVILDDLRSPRKRIISGIELQHQNQIGLSTDGYEAEEVLVAVCGIAPLPVRGWPIGCILVPQQPEVVIEVVHRRSAATRVICVVIMVSKRSEVGDVCGVKHLISDSALTIGSCCRHC